MLNRLLAAFGRAPKPVRDRYEQVKAALDGVAKDTANERTRQEVIATTAGAHEREHRRFLTDVRHAELIAGGHAEEHL